ncbi:MAG: hypothetical protein KIS89_09640 [Dokdonella sp.]|uniref:hypothetical protein n=1 Tax=Dokdonella sp. TaxID=2291710 RepID=UPI0027B8DC09|nr:hypothetical protein [Dokdonella sp.]MCW5578895.1 hypothetical protein [Dokdonella sp.]
MTDFELQRGLRAQRTDHPPARDLWPAIAAAVAAGRAAPMRRHRRLLPWLAAACLVMLAIGAGTLLRPWQAATPQPLASTSIAPLRAARTRPPNDDPRLLAGAIVLDAAHAQIEQALASQPDNALLGDLLKRTQARRARLLHDAGRTG